MQCKYLESFTLNTRRQSLTRMHRLENTSQKSSSSFNKGEKPEARHLGNLKNHYCGCSRKKEIHLCLDLTYIMLGSIIVAGAPAPVCGVCSSHHCLPTVPA